ncbi:hypothetical protein FKP32DRAFT_1590179 [Trametes sanguinea]|nr:hypothetical protein FKP32DRAFT_1590179 [Trametes sanguinea]
MSFLGQELACVCGLLCAGFTSPVGEEGQNVAYSGTRADIPLHMQHTGVLASDLGLRQQMIKTRWRLLTSRSITVIMISHLSYDMPHLDKVGHG